MLHLTLQFKKWQYIILAVERQSGSACQNHPSGGLGVFQLISPCIIFLFITGFVAIPWSIAGLQPTELKDLQISPRCIEVRPGCQTGHGTGITIHNSCKEIVTVKTVQYHRDHDGKIYKSAEAYLFFGGKFEPRIIFLMDAESPTCQELHWEGKIQTEKKCGGFSLKPGAETLIFVSGGLEAPPSNWDFQFNKLAKECGVETSLDTAFDELRFFFNQIQIL